MVHPVIKTQDREGSKVPRLFQRMIFVKVRNCWNYLLLRFWGLTVKPLIRNLFLWFQESSKFNSKTSSQSLREKKMHTWGVRFSNRILLISMYFLVFSPNYEHPEVKPQTSPISKLPLFGMLFTEVISAAAIFAKGGMLINHGSTFSTSNSTIFISYWRWWRGQISTKCSKLIQRFFLWPPTASWWCNGRRRGCDHDGRHQPYNRIMASSPVENRNGGSQKL